MFGAIKTIGKYLIVILLVPGVWAESFHLKINSERTGRTTKIKYSLPQSQIKKILKRPELKLKFFIEAEPELKRIAALAKEELAAGQNRLELYANGFLIDAPEETQRPAQSCCKGFWNGFAEGARATARGETLKEDLAAFAAGATLGPILDALIKQIPLGKLLALGGVLAMSKDFMVSRTERYRHKKGWSESFIRGRVVFDLIKDFALIGLGLKSSQGLFKLLLKLGQKNSWAAFLVDFLVKTFGIKSSGEITENKTIPTREEVLTFEDPPPPVNSFVPSAAPTLEKPRIKTSPAPTQKAPAPATLYKDVTVTPPSLEVAPLSTMAFILKEFLLWKMSVDWNPKTLIVLHRIETFLKKTSRYITPQHRQDLTYILSIEGVRLPKLVRAYAVMHTDLPNHAETLEHSKNDWILLQEALTGQRTLWHIQIIRAYVEKCRLGRYTNRADCEALEAIWKSLTNVAQKNSEIFISNSDDSSSDKNTTFFLESAIRFFMGLVENERKNKELAAIYLKLKQLEHYREDDLALILDLYSVHLSDVLYEKSRPAETLENAWNRLEFKFSKMRFFLFRANSAQVDKIIFSPLPWAIDRLLGKTSAAKIYEQAVREAEGNFWSHIHRNILIALLAMPDDPLNPLMSLQSRAKKVIDHYEITYTQDEAGWIFVTRDPVDSATSRAQAENYLTYFQKFEELRRDTPGLSPAFLSNDVLTAELPRLTVALKNQVNLIYANEKHPYMWIRANNPLAWSYFISYVTSVLVNRDLPEQQRVHLPRMQRILDNQGYYWFVIDMKPSFMDPLARASLPSTVMSHLALLDALTGNTLEHPSSNIHKIGALYYANVMHAPMHPISIIHWSLNRLKKEFGLSPTELFENGHAFIAAISSEKFKDDFRIVSVYYRMHYTRELYPFWDRFDGLVQWSQDPLGLRLQTLPTKDNLLPGREEIMQDFANIDPNFISGLSSKILNLLKTPFYFGNIPVNPAEIFSMFPYEATQLILNYVRQVDPRHHIYDDHVEALLSFFENSQFLSMKIFFTNQHLNVYDLNRLPVYVLVFENSPSYGSDQGWFTHDLLFMHHQAFNNIKILATLLKNRDTPRALQFYESFRVSYLRSLAPVQNLAGEMIWYYFWRMFEHEASYSNSLLTLGEKNNLPHFKKRFFEDLNQDVFGFLSAKEISAIKLYFDEAFLALKKTANDYKVELRQINPN